MRASAAFCAAVVLSAVMAPPAQASIAVVPDSFPTIQAGIDSWRDTVLVRAGRYDEDLTVMLGVTLGVIPEAGADTVETGGLSVVDFVYPIPPRYIPYRRVIDIRGFHFRGPLREAGTSSEFYTFTISACRVDSGVVLAPYHTRDVSIDSCTIRGGLSIDTMGYPVVAHSTILGGGIHVHAEADYMIRGNHVTGPADYGIRAYTEGWAPLDSNTVAGAEVGIYVLGNGVVMQDNTVTGCSSTGILAGIEHPSISRNLIQDCGGYGVDVASRMSPSGVTANTVLACQSGGMRIRDDSGNRPPLLNNVVGRCGGPGIDAAGTADATDFWRIQGNTSYLNSGPGFSLAGTGTNMSIIANNISFGNTGPGLLWTGSETLELACNDWFGNAGGATSGTLPGSTDLAVDPLFCDPGQDDVHLSATSPLLDASGCGLIGALGQGCAGVPTPVLLSFVTADVTPEGVMLTWFASGSSGAVATVYRSTAGGEWTRIGEVVADGTGYLRYIAPLLTTTTRLGYRLGVVEAGIESFYGETWVDLPALRFALDGARPNPARGGALTVHFTLPSAAPARVELLDVSGRRVVEREVGSLGPGHHALSLGEGCRLAPGVYLVRLTQGTSTRVTRVAVLK